RAEDYAVERCGKTSGWLRQCRSTARHLAELPALRAALRTGEVSWSMAEFCARKATSHRDAEVAERAKASTVRQMRAYFGQGSAPSCMPDMQPEPDLWGSEEEADLLARCDEEGWHGQKKKE